MKFTLQQLKDFVEYERVRRSGKFNMFDPRARLAAGLSLERYSFVMTHYSELSEAVNKTKGK